jgi:putative oxidoreductase
MAVLRALAQPMLASIFIIQGYETYRHPERAAPRAEPVVRPLADRFPAVPAKTEDAVRLNGAVQMVAGSLLALGRWPRLSALVIAATLVPTTLAGHRFWEAEEESTKLQQRIHFLKNVSIFGGLLIAVADTAGKRTAKAPVKGAVWTARILGKGGTRSAKTLSKGSATAGRLSGRLAA